MNKNIKFFYCYYFLNFNIYNFLNIQFFVILNTKITLNIIFCLSFFMKKYKGKIKKKILSKKRSNDKPTNVSNDSNTNKKNDSSNKKFYQCSDCNKKYEYKRNLTRHIKENHSKIDSLTCPFCSKYFVRLKEHIRTCKNGILLKISSLFEEKDQSIISEENEYISSNNFIIGSNDYKNNNIKIGEGTFGIVYYGTIIENNIPVAIKIIKTGKENLLKFENETQALMELSKELFFPKYYYSNTAVTNNTIIQSLHGPNLKALHNFCFNRFPLYTILNIGIELLKRIKVIHSHGIIHRDLKPSNIVYGKFNSINSAEKDSIYIIDYGLSKRYINKNNKHFEFFKTGNFVGTLEFTSRTSLNFDRKSRRDDVESIFYILIYLFKGTLPWSRFKEDLTKLEQYKQTKNCMESIDPKNLLNGLPNVFQFIYKNIKILNFEEEPPYDHFITLLEKEKINLIRNKIIKTKYKFIWTDIIIEMLNQKNLIKEEKLVKIENLFHKQKINIIREYFENIPIDNINF